MAWVLLFCSLKRLPPSIIFIVLLAKEFTFVYPMSVGNLFIIYPIAYRPNNKYDCFDANKNPPVWKIWNCSRNSTCKKNILLFVEPCWSSARENWKKVRDFVSNFHRWKIVSEYLRLKFCKNQIFRGQGLKIRVGFFGMDGFSNTWWVQENCSQRPGRLHWSVIHGSLKIMDFLRKIA